MKLTLCKTFGGGEKRKQQIKEFPTHRVLKKTITFQTILYVWDKEKKVFMKKSNQNLVLKSYKLII